MIVALAISLLIASACSFAVILICHFSPIVEEPMDDEEDRLHRIFLTAMHHREHLDACFHEVCEIHEFVQDSFGYDTIADVIYAGHSYSEAMERIMRHEAWEREEG